MGLLLLRLISAAALIVPGVRLEGATSLLSSPSGVIAAAAGLLLLAGVWTSASGALIAVTEVWLVFSHGSNPWVSSLLAGIGAAVALLGPGAWSVDARLYGWKRIDIRRPRD